MVLAVAMAAVAASRALAVQALLAAAGVVCRCGVETSVLLLNETKAPTALKTLVCATQMSKGAVHRANELSCSSSALEAPRTIGPVSRSLLLV